CTRFSRSRRVKFDIAFAPACHTISARRRKSGSLFGAGPGARRRRFTLRPGRLACLHARSRSRFLVRFCLDLLLSRRHADRTAGGKSRGPGAVPSVPARTDFQGARLDPFAVQSLPGQRPPYVARPRAVMRGVAVAVPASRSLPAEQFARGPRGAGRARPGLGRSILPRDVSRAIRRRTPHRRCRDRRRHPDGTQARSRGALAAAQSDAIKTQLRAQTEEAQRLGVFGAPSFTTADGELFWGNDRLEPALRWAKAAAARS